LNYRNVSGILILQLLNISGTFSTFLGTANWDGVFSVIFLLLAGAVGGADYALDIVAFVLAVSIDASIKLPVGDAYFLSELFLSSATFSPALGCFTSSETPLIIPGIWICTSTKLWYYKIVSFPTISSLWMFCAAYYEMSLIIFNFLSIGIALCLRPVFLPSAILFIFLVSCWNLSKYLPIGLIIWVSLCFTNILIFKLWIILINFNKFNKLLNLFWLNSNLFKIS